MVEQNPSQLMAQGTKRRHVMMSEFGTRFRSKEDFLRYFKEARKHPLRLV